MAVRIRMKRMGRTHRPFYRVCAVDGRRPRDGRVIEELGVYDPMVKHTDARAVLKAERIDYWLSVGAQPSDRVKVLIKKYGSNGTHLESQKQALESLKVRPTAPPPTPVKLPAAEKPKPEAAEETPTDAAPADAESTGEDASAAASPEAVGEEAKTDKSSE